MFPQLLLPPSVGKYVFHWAQLLVSCLGITLRQGHALPQGGDAGLARMPLRCEQVARQPNIGRSICGLERPDRP
jgi:hypothetical protein